MEHHSTLSYVKEIIKAQPNAPRDCDLGLLLKINFASFRGKVLWGMGIIFALAGIGIIFTLVNWETTVLGIFMILIGLGLTGYLVYFTLNVYNALETGAACVVPSSRVESNEKGKLSTVDINEFKITEENAKENFSLREGDKVLVFVDAETNTVLFKFNMIWEMSG